MSEPISPHYYSLVPEYKNLFQHLQETEKGRVKAKDITKEMGKGKAAGGKFIKKQQDGGMGDRGKVLDAIVQELSRFFSGMFLMLNFMNFGRQHEDFMVVWKSLGFLPNITCLTNDFG